MGSRSSKLVITPENVETPVNGATEVITQLKSNGENGNGDVIPAMDAAVESNSDCQIADTTVDTIPANGSISETKPAQKKANPINWIQKKISFKKAKTPKKPTPEENPTEPAIEELQPVTVEEENEDTPPQVKPESVHSQSEGIVRFDRATISPEVPEDEVTTEPVVEITPSTEEVQNNVGVEHFVEEEEPKEKEKEEEEVHQNGGVSHKEPVEESHTDLSLAEKMVYLGIDAVEPLTNGNGIHLGVDAIAPTDEN